ncbi:hypothetical protein L798_14010 [Zootermopsis nevadensis]|uniref:Uncharacterized protein n=1 Tax=Zootermopsis nevadensis TaxID=136037 RepID=A0A067R2U8_ZOONE|nr:hypothetical protein L798_14010 [Zootermopsis nevadensis]
MLPTRPRSVQKLVKPKNKDRSAERSESSSDQQIECIETALDLSKFLSKEDKLRKKSSGGSLTSRLDKLQWHMLRKTLCGLVRKLDSKSVVKGSDKYENIMKRAREEILLRIQ